MAILIANLTYSPFLLKQFAKPKSLPSVGALVRWWSRGGVEGASSPTAANSDQVIANKSYFINHKPLKTFLRPLVSDRGIASRGEIFNF